MKAILAFLAVATLEIASGASLRALLIDGAEWKDQTAPIKSILEMGEVLKVDVLTAPAKGEAFNPQFDRYKVIVLNYGGDSWPVTTIASLEKYLQNGGGLVALYTADAAFPQWSDYNTILGVDGAPNRDKNAGPMWFYKDGKFAFSHDDVGPVGKAPHPDQPYVVTTRNTEHPIAKGIPLNWMHATDTLAGYLRGPGKNMTVIGTAHSDEKRGGTGLDEPVMLAITYGKGRIFHILMGRTDDGIACVGFQTLLQRGAEWAGSGKVTVRIPNDFPHEDKVSTRPVK